MSFFLFLNVYAGFGENWFISKNSKTGHFLALKVPPAQ